MRPVRRPGGRTTGLREVLGGRVPRAQVIEAFKLGERIAELRQEQGGDEYQRGWDDALEAVRLDDERDQQTDDLMDLAEAVGVDRPRDSDEKVRQSLADFRPHRCQPTGRRRRR